MSKVQTSAWIGAAVLALCAAFTSDASARAIEGSCLPGVLRERLAEIEKQFGAVEIVSAHRRGARIAGSGRMSYHASCRAVDFNPPKGKYAEVAAWLKNTHLGGVGTYGCGMNHIHIDNGPRVRFHKCQGGGRQIARSSRGKSRKYAKRNSGRKYAARSSNRKYAARSSNRKSWRHAASRGTSRRYASASGGTRYGARSSRRYASRGRSNRYAGRYARRSYY